jgi:hypothetical protein
MIMEKINERRTPVCGRCKTPYYGAVCRQPQCELNRYTIKSTGLDKILDLLATTDLPPYPVFHKAHVPFYEKLPSLSAMLPLQALKPPAAPWPLIGHTWRSDD